MIDLPSIAPSLAELVPMVGPAFPSLTRDECYRIAMEALDEVGAFVGPLRKVDLLQLLSDAISRRKADMR